MDFERTDRQFRDHASDLLRSDSHDFGHKLQVFIHFVNEDPTLAEIAGPLLAADVDLQGWLKRISGSRGLELPLEDKDCAALIIQLLSSISEGKTNVLHVAHAVCYERKFDDIIRSFNDKFTRLLVRYLSERLRSLAPPAAPAHGTVIHTGTGSTSTIAIGSNITQKVGVGGDELQEILDALREALAKNTALGSSVKVELQDDVDILEREARRTAPRTEIVLTVLQSLAAVPGLVDLVQRAAALFKVVIG